MLLMSLLVGGMVLALPLYLMRKEKPVVDPGAPDGQAAPKASTKAPIWASDGSAGKGMGAPPAPVVSEAALAPTEADPEYATKLAKHKAISNFMNSPVRDTPACRAILKLLMENGYGIEQLEQAYHAAWEVRNRDPLYSQTQFFTGDGQKVTADTPEIRAFTAQLFERAKEEQAKVLSEKGGIKDRELITALLEVRPQEAWAAAAKNDGKPPANLLSEAQLEEYLESHPEK